MVSASVQRAVVSATINSVLVEILLYGTLHSIHGRILLSNVCIIGNVPSGMYAAVYTGTVYIYSKNKYIALTLTAKIWINSVKKVTDKLLHCCIHHKFIHSPCHQTDLQLDDCNRNHVNKYQASKPSRHFVLVYRL